MTADMKTIQECLEERKSFRLGARGTCIDFKYFLPSDSWCVRVPRASLNLSWLEVKIWGSTTLALICCDVSIAYIDLVDFDKVTVIE